MSSQSDMFLTQEGYQKLKEELDFLKTVKRREISRQIGKARLMGDLSENAEYDAAKEAQARLEERVISLEDKLARARIIDHEDIPKDKVYVGARVKLLDVDSEEELEYMLVCAPEANYEENKISVTSPIGKALLGHKPGDVVEITIPAGLLHYKIKSISR